MLNGLCRHCPDNLEELVATFHKLFDEKIKKTKALATVLGVNLRSDKELDTLFDEYRLDWDGDTAITCGEWRDFVKRLHAMAGARRQV